MEKLAEPWCAAALPSLALNVDRAKASISLTHDPAHSPVGLWLLIPSHLTSHSPVAPVQVLRPTAKPSQAVLSTVLLTVDVT